MRIPRAVLTTAALVALIAAVFAAGALWRDHGLSVEVAQAAPAAQEATPTPAPEEEGEQAQATPAAQEEQPTAGAAAIPTERSAVLQPAGSLPVDLSLQVELVAEGLVDPVNVVSPRDGSGRLFVVERCATFR